MKRIIILIGKIGGISGGAILVLFLIIAAREGRRPQKGIFNNLIIKHIYAERDKARVRVGLMAVNSFKPTSWDFFYEFIQGQGTVKAEGLGRYVNYYQRVAEYYPDVPGGYEILGFCYYHLGKRQKAREAYAAAMAIRPDFFWPYYNLGILYFQKGQYQKAADLFRTATGLNPAITFKKMLSSRAYGEILRVAPQFNYAADQNLKECFQNSSKLLTLSDYYLKNALQVSGADFLEKNGIDVQLF